MSSLTHKIAFFVLKINVATEIHTQKHACVSIILKFRTCFVSSSHFIVSLMGNIFSRERPYLSFIAAQSERIIASPQLRSSHMMQRSSSSSSRVLTWCWSTSDAEVKVAFLVYGQRRAAIQFVTAWDVSDVFSHPIAISGKLTCCLNINKPHFYICGAYIMKAKIFLFVFKALFGG